LPYDKINELVCISVLRRSPRGPALLDAMTQSHIRKSGSSPESPSLVGRRAEQELLRDDLAAAREGRGGLVVLSGEAGIGKTSLARDLVGEAIRTGVCVLIGHCYDLTVTPPYGPWLDLAATYRPADGMPVLPDAFATGRIEEIESQAALFADVRSFFAELASIQPVLIVLEDLHWADPASIELLRSLGAGVAAQSMLVLVTYRSDELTRTQPLYHQLPSLLRETGGRRLDLRPLATQDLRSLVHTNYPMPEAEEERLVAYLERHAEGNPFFVVEFLRAISEEGFLRSTGETWSLGELDRIVVPSLLRQVIDARVSRLGDEMREPLSVAAVIGHDISLDLWARVLGLDEETLLTIVERAIDAHLLNAAPDGTRVRFVHALTRAALYEAVMPPRRRIWHQRVGDALVAQSRVSPEEVAFQFERAGDPRAWEWYVRAGERAQRAYAWLMAKDRFVAAATLIENVPGMEARRSRLLYRSGRLQRYSEIADGIANLAAAERAANQAGNRVLAADAKYSRGLLRCFSDDFGSGLVEMEEGIVELEELPADEAMESWERATWLADALPPSELSDLPDFEPSARIMIAAGTHHRRGGHPWFLAAAGHLSRARAMAEKFIALTAGIPAGELVISATGHSWFGLGLANAVLGRPDDARQAFARARQIYDLIEHHAVIGFTQLSELRDVVLPYFATDVAGRTRLAADAETSLNLAAGAFPSDRSSRRARLGLLFLEGGWDEADAIASEVEADGNYVLRREITNAMTPLWYAQGKTELAQRQIRKLLPQGPAAEPGEVVLVDALLLQRVAADMALDRGDLAGALAWIEANDRWLEWSGAVLGRAENRLSWARYCRRAGDLALATRHVEGAVDAASDPRQPLALIAALRMFGELHTGFGEIEAAKRDLAEALALADACAAPYERALTLIARAELHLAVGRQEDVRADLIEARALLVQLNAQPATNRIDALLSRLGVPRDAAPAGLTSREIEVLRLVAKGMTDAEVAKNLYISPRTVSQHLRSVYGKLDVSSRSAATRFAIEHNLA
jgi:DNA-binding CsgD family transcriptional regulator